MTKQERFDYLQQRWQQADDKMRDYSYALKRQYGDARGYCWNVPNGKRERQQRLEDAESRACSRFVDYLYALNPDREWSRGFPVGWLMSSLTFEDATTRERMSVTPTPAPGFTQKDAESFAAALS